MSLKLLLQEISNCQICIEKPHGKPLPHAPRPVLRVSKSARLAVAGQAPGTRVHASGKPFTDPSGDRLRDWMGVSEQEFYDTRRLAIVPMGFCFPGLDEKGGDLPPRKECAQAWRAPLFELVPNLDLILLVGAYAQRWHLGARAKTSMTDTVANWSHYMNCAGAGPRYLPLPHPSWRNNHWLKKNPWFDDELVPVLRTEVRKLISPKRKHPKSKKPKA